MIAKPRSERIPLEKALHPEQHYVFGHPQAFRMQAWTHAVPTSTCYEKANLIGFSPERVVKALYFTNGERTFGIILPETGSKINSGKILSQSFSGLSRNVASRSFRNGQIPLGMEHGTCTPFPRSDARVDGFVVHYAPHLDDQLVDVSVGGTGEKWHKTSLHVPYRIIPDILQERYAGNVFVTDVFRS